MATQDIEIVENFIKDNKADNAIKMSFDKIKKEFIRFEQNKIIKEDLGDTSYAKIFDTAIKNVELEKELEFSMKNNVIVDTPWYALSPSVHWIGSIIMMLFLVALIYLLPQNIIVQQNSKALKELLENQKVIMQKLNIEDK